MGKVFEILVWIALFVMFVGIAIWSVASDSPLSNYRACDINVYGYCEVEVEV